MTVKRELTDRERQKVRDLPCHCQPCIDVWLDRTPHPYHWGVLHEVPRATLCKGDAWVVPGTGAAWWTAGNGRVSSTSPMAFSGPGGIAWVVVDMAPDGSYVARRHDGAHEFRSVLTGDPKRTVLAVDRDAVKIPRRRADVIVHDAPRPGGVA